jgi:hypothetical protein
VHPQPRLGTRYEKSLKRRFEKADQVFSEIYLRKPRWVYRKGEMWTQRQVP